MKTAKQYTRQPFNVKFTQARQHIWEYLELGREAQSRTYRSIAEQKTTKQAGKLTPAHKKPERVCHEITS